MIEFEQVTKRYKGGHEAVTGLSFSMDQGEMAFLTGHSGAGKSTLLKLIANIERPSSGQVRVAGQLLNNMSHYQIPFYRRQLGIVFQNHHLLMDKSVFDNVALPLVIEGEGPRDIARRVHAALDKVGLLDRADYLPVMLSGGEQQRVGIARAVVTKPKLLLADEPTGNLDPVLSREIMNLFADFNRVGTTVLIASHDLGLIARMPFRVMTLKAGQMIHTGRTESNER